MTRLDGEHRYALLPDVPDWLALGWMVVSAPLPPGHWSVLVWWACECEPVTPKGCAT